MCVGLAVCARIGEATCLRWSSVHLDAATLAIGPSLSRRQRRWIVTAGKTHAVKTLALPDFAVGGCAASARGRRPIGSPPAPGGRLSPGWRT